jgi:hypothetical protein
MFLFSTRPKNKEAAAFLALYTACLERELALAGLPSSAAAESLKHVKKLLVDVPPEQRSLAIEIQRQLEDPAAVALLKAARTAHSVTHLRIGQAIFSLALNRPAVLGEELARLLATNQNLVSLDISSCPLGDNGVSAVLQALGSADAAPAGSNPAASSSAAAVVDAAANGRIAHGNGVAAHPSTSFTASSALAASLNGPSSLRDPEPGSAGSDRDHDLPPSKFSRQTSASFSSPSASSPRAGSASLPTASAPSSRSSSITRGLFQTGVLQGDSNLREFKMAAVGLTKAEPLKHWQSASLLSKVTSLDISKNVLTKEACVEVVNIIDSRQVARPFSIPDSLHLF